MEATVPATATPVVLTDDMILANPEKYQGEEYLGRFVTLLDDTNYACWAFAWEVGKIAIIIIYATAAVAALITLGILYPVAIPFAIAGGVVGALILQQAIYKFNEKAAENTKAGKMWNGISDEIEKINLLTADQVEDLMRKEGIDPEQIEHIDAIRELNKPKENQPAKPLKTIYNPLAKQQYWKGVAEAAEKSIKDRSAIADDEAHTKPENFDSRVSLLNENFNEKEGKLLVAKIYSAFFLALVLNPFAGKDFEIPGILRPLPPGARKDLEDAGDPIANDYFVFNDKSRPSLDRYNLLEMSISEIAHAIFGPTSKLEEIVDETDNTSGNEQRIVEEETGGSTGSDKIDLQQVEVVDE